MKTLNFKKIDAFTKGLSSGNPAGYVYMEKDYLENEEMQKMASELKGFVNEVGFVKRSKDEFILKFFSSECEVAFCGHATIAIMYDLIKNNKELVEKDKIFINVNAGKLPVFNELLSDDAVYITAPLPKFLEVPVNKLSISNSLGIALSDINEKYSIRFIDGGLRTLLVPINGLEKILSIYPNQEALKSFCLKNDIDIILVFTEKTNFSNCKYRTRVFAPKFGYLEDPATGSGNSAFGYYLIDENLWEDDFTIEQSANKENPNFVKIKRYTSNGENYIMFGGAATTKISGDYFIHKNK
jgi:PhzF family phenazine biosynthesis protein